jgi:hypothetical protein
MQETKRSENTENMEGKEKGKHNERKIKLGNVARHGSTIWEPSLPFVLLSRKQKD